MQHETKWLDKIVEEKGIDAVISDNRPGLYSRKVPSVYITHQLHIKTGNKLADVVAGKVHQGFINQFTYCWVPDAVENGLAGELSQQSPNIKIPVEYIGPQSRMKHIDSKEEIDWLFLFSGPEPGRSYFENEVFKILPQLNGTIEIVRGKPTETNIPKSSFNVTIHNHLPAKVLNQKMAGAKKIIARGGYSTIMDLASIKKSAILIPTPGQTEQEYLCKYLHNKKYFSTITDKEFHKIPNIEIPENYLPHFTKYLDKAIEKLLSSK